MVAARTTGAPRGAAAAETDLLLVGGGHAHVQVVRRWMMDPVPGVRLTLVLDRPEAVYSGMVPGLVAGDYEVSELEIDCVPLARRAGARVVLAAAVSVDPDAGRVELEGRPPLRFDLASLDVGSSVRGLQRPGVREHAVATRPIRRLVDELDVRLERLAADRPEPRLAVVGGGAAGLELAFTLHARLRASGLAPEVVVIADSSEVLPGHPRRVARRVRREADGRGIRVLRDARVERVEKRAVVLAGDGERLGCDLVVWATGAAPPSLLARSALPLDAAGFVRIDDTLHVEGQDTLFAVGDCASLVAHPWVPRAGVYAVRQGPVLDHNLRARLSGRRLRRYRPQRDFLALLNLGDRRALGAKWGLTAAGPGVWRLKDRIDRRFMERFQVLGPAGEPAARFPTPEAMGMEPMECGGCAAKLGATDLTAALARMEPPPADDSVLLGLARPDDAAAWRAPGGDLVLASVDAFRAFTDDPWLVGRVAAVNAASDVLAKGGRPRHALALVTVPDQRPARAEETLYQVLAGMRAALDPLGISLVGGHTTRGGELFVGLTITGELGRPEQLLRLDGARPGDRLLLTKPLGSGVVLAADMQGLARGAWVRAAHASMLRPNEEAARLARRSGATACTDVSGFGLAGHLAELLRASRVSAHLRLARIPALEGALALLGRGIRSSYHEQNAHGAREAVAGAGPKAGPAFELLFDPQTSGGLLFAVPADRADDALRRLREVGDGGAAEIGELTPERSDGAVFEVG